MGLKSYLRTSLLWSLTTVMAVGFSASSAHAALTYVSASGTSNEIISDTGTVTIYGGFTDGCTGDGGSSISTCDSCTSTTGLKVCNYRNAYEGLKVTFTLNGNTNGFVVTDFYYARGTNEQKTVTTVPTISTGSLVATLTWGEICGVLSNGTNNCTDGLTGELTLGLKNSSSTESVTVSVRIRDLRGASTTSTYKDCPNAQADANYGLCHFQVVKGDEKLYADPTILTESYPNTGVSGLNYTGVVFYYAPYDGTSDITTLAAINNKSSFKRVSVNTATSKLGDNRITGLSNNQRYCVLAGNEDASGIISNFTPVPGQPNSQTSAELCETPTKVVGLLDDKECFIATAAFGSSLSPQVDVFRAFRNQFLLSNPVGKKFVQFYYEHSPYYADLIAQSNSARAVVRGALWPLLLFSQLALKFGFGVALVAGLLSITGICYISRRVFARKEKVA